MNSKNSPFNECEYCEKKFASSEKFDKHKCEMKQRAEFCKTKKGLNAFYDYSYWIKLKSKNIPTLNTFINSKYYSRFVWFQEYSAEKGIPDKKIYLKFVVDKGININMWNSNLVWNSFINYFDSDIDPMVKVKISLKTLKLLADIFECEEGDVYEFLLPSEIGRLLFERKLSPWLLLLSNRFKHHLHMMDSTQYAIITSVLDEKEWNNRFKSNKDMVNQIKEIISDLNV